MNALGKTLVSIFSILVIACVGVVIYVYWPAITGTINNKKYYTAEDVEKSYNQGLEDGNKNSTELNSKYEYFKSLCDDYYIQVNTLTGEVEALQSKNLEYVSTIDSLKASKLSLTNQVTELTNTKNENEKTINELNVKITTLEGKITELNREIGTKDSQNSSLTAQVEQLTNQVASLRVLTENLEQINASNANTITSLNAQITALNAKISELTTSSEDSLNRINALNNKINQLQKTISYYEEYIANLENDNQAVVTFEYDGSIYTIQIVTKGSKIAVVNPESTTYKVFNGWLLNNESVDLETLIVNNNIKLIADVTYKFDVKFMNGDVEHDAQIVTKNSYATIPTNPTKEGYRFDGWSADGINIVTNIDSTAVVENITYTAMFTKVHSVKYMLEDMVDHEQQVANNEYPTEFVISSTNKRVFNGWKLNGVIVDPTTIRITADTIFVADLTYKYEITFTSPYLENDTVTQYIEAGQKITNIPTLTNVPTGLIFRGWVDELNPDVIIDLTTFTVSNDMHFTARVEEVHGFDEVMTSVTEDYICTTSINTTFVNPVNENYVVMVGGRLYEINPNTLETVFIKETYITGKFLKQYNENLIFISKTPSNGKVYVSALSTIDYSVSNIGYFEFNEFYSYEIFNDNIVCCGVYEHTVNNKTIYTGGYQYINLADFSKSDYIPLSFVNSTTFNDSPDTAILKTDGYSDNLYLLCKDPQCGGLDPKYILCVIDPNMEMCREYDFGTTVTDISLIFDNIVLIQDNKYLVIDEPAVLDNLVFEESEFYDEILTNGYYNFKYNSSTDEYYCMYDSGNGYLVIINRSTQEIQKIATPFVNATNTYFMFIDEVNNKILFCGYNKDNGRVFVYYYL